MRDDSLRVLSTEVIPANPLSIGIDEDCNTSPAYREIVAANTSTRVEPKVTVVIPPPPVDIQIESRPAPRRSFVQPPVVMQDQVFRSRR